MPRATRANRRNAAAKGSWGWSQAVAFVVCGAALIGSIVARIPAIWAGLVIGIGLPWLPPSIAGGDVQGDANDGFKILLIVVALIEAAYLVALLLGLPFELFERPMYRRRQLGFVLGMLAGMAIGTIGRTWYRSPR
jgi:hypothetical protein